MSVEVNVDVGGNITGHLTTRPLDSGIGRLPAARHLGPPIPLPSTPPFVVTNNMAFPAPHESVSLPLPHPEAYPGEAREYARALMQRKDDIEKEIVRART